MNTSNTPAQRAMACLHKTPNGGWAVRSGCAAEFDAIPCVHEEHLVLLVIVVEDRYTFDGGEGYDLVLSIAWGDDEFSIVPSPDRAAVVVVEDEDAAANYEAHVIEWLSGGYRDWDGES